MKNKFLRLAKRSRDKILSLLFPPRCPVCDELLEPERLSKGIHPACECKLYSIYGAVCMHCGRPLHPIKKTTTEYWKSTELRDECRTEYEVKSASEYCYECIRKGYVSHPGKKGHSNIRQGKSLYLYRGEIKQTIYRLKYSNKREYARFFAEKAWGKYGKWMKQNHIQVIVPVPMYRKKQKKRGYNQAESLAYALSEYSGIPVATNLVYRVEDTTPQKELDHIQRKNNLKSAFQHGESVVQYTCAMVVDDIYTTGSTAEAVAHELIKLGTHQVYLLTVCIGGDM